MKRFFIVTTVMILLVSSACADCFSDFAIRWNLWQDYYPCITLSEDDAEISDDHCIFKGDTWKVILIRNGDHIKSLGIYSEDFETLMAGAIIAGLILVKDSEGLGEYVGFVTMKYFDAKTSEDKNPMVFGSYTYGFVRVDNGYMFTLIEL